MVWPDGKENLSGGRTFDQQCGSSWHGRCLWLRLFRILKTATPAKAALAAALTAANLCGPPNTSKSAASAYHSHPSPSRVAAIIQIRIQRGARQRFSRRIRRWSRRSMKPQTWRATVISLVHDLHQVSGFVLQTLSLIHQIRSAPGRISHSMRGDSCASSKCVAHFRQNHFSFIQCPAVNTGTRTASGSSASVAGFSCSTA